MALLPLFGLDLVLFGQVELSAANVDDANLHLFMVRSAARAIFAQFPKASVISRPFTVFLLVGFDFRSLRRSTQHLTFYLFTLALVLIAALCLCERMENIEKRSEDGTSASSSFLSVCLCSSRRRWGAGF